VKKAHKIKIIVVLGFIAVVFGSALLSVAHSGYTQECGSCHSDAPGLTLTSNATGTVYADVGISFTLVYDSTGYTRGDNKVAISLRGGWADNDQFTFTPTEVMDASGGDLNAATDEVRASFSFTPASAGSWTIRVWTAGKGKQSGSLDVSVSVTAPDTTPPTVDDQPDFSYAEGATGNSITWNPSDANPSSYEIYLEEVLTWSGAWNSSSETITINVDGHSLGTYNYTVVVTDVVGYSARDVVLVTVYDGTAPIVDDQPDFSYDEGQIGNSITWSPSDLHPVTYDIYIDEVLNKSGLWNSTGETISISADGLTVGIYNFTLVVTDIGGNFDRDVALVTVLDVVLPTVDDQPNFSYAEGASGNSITWNPNDLHPASYEIYLDEVLIRSGTWNSSSETITISVDGHSLGTYNYTVVVTDVGGNSAQDVVLVTVYDGTAPIVDNQPNFSYAEGASGNSITWNPYDLHPASYEIYLDEVLIRSGTWNSSSETINIIVDGHPLGTFNYTVVVTDGASVTARDVVLVTVYDGTLPVVGDQPNFSYPNGSTGNSITWTPSDTHPVSYEIYLDDVMIRSGAWNSSGESITISVDGHNIGTYNYTLRVTDVGGNTGKDVVLVTVYSTVVPSIINAPDQNMVEGSAGNEIVWDPLDLNPQNYSIYKDYVVFRTGLWNSSSEIITVLIDGLTLGLYNYTLVVQDQDGNTARDVVLVTVYDGTTPIVDDQLDFSYIEGASENNITWNPSDLHPVSYEIYLDEVLIKSGQWNTTGEIIIISVDGHSVGTYNYTLIVTDIGGNTDRDVVLVSVLDIIPPTVDDQQDFNYDEGQIGNSITWTPSDLHPLSYEIYMDDIVIRTGPWNVTGETVTITVDGLSVGTYNYTLVVIDLGGNTDMDVVLVTVLDVVLPSVDDQPNFSYAEGQVGNSITWSPSDTYPASYEIFLDEIVVKSGLWNSSSETITLSADGHTPGIYNYTLVVTDIGGNSARDVVLVTVYDSTFPQIDDQPDFSYSEGSEGNIITWSPTDTNPSSYEIYLDDVVVKSGLWNSSSEPITISVDGHSLGIYNYTVVVIDTGNNLKRDVVLVTVYDGAIPIVDDQPDFSYEEGVTGNSITWNPSDAHPASYIIYKDDAIHTTMSWDGSAVSIIVDTLMVGIYNYTIVVEDIGGNTASDTVIVTVTAPPTTPTDPTTPNTSTTPPTTPPTTETPEELSPASMVLIWVAIGVLLILGGWCYAAGRRT
jgi:hypothetical protein